MYGTCLKKTTLWEGYVILFYFNIVPSVGKLIVCCDGITAENIDDKFLAASVNLEFEVCVPVRIGACFCMARIHISCGYHLQ
jgi:hypothetical protein